MHNCITKYEQKATDYKPRRGPLADQNYGKHDLGSMKSAPFTACTLTLTGTHKGAKNETVMSTVNIKKG